MGGLTSCQVSLKQWLGFKNEMGTEQGWCMQQGKACMWWGRHVMKGNTFIWVLVWVLVCAEVLMIRWRVHRFAHSIGLTLWQSSSTSLYSLVQSSNRACRTRFSPDLKVKHKRQKKSCVTKPVCVEFKRMTSHIYPDSSCTWHLFPRANKIDMGSFFEDWLHGNKMILK